MSCKRIIYILLILLMNSSAFAQFVSVDKINNMGKIINSSGNDFSPSLTADGKTLVFSSKRDGSRYQHIYISFLKDGEWTPPVMINSINSKYNDENPYITPDGEYIFFDSDRDGSFELPPDQSGQIKVSCDIYVTKNINGRWDAPIKLPGSVNTTNHERMPGLSQDYKILFYTSVPFGSPKRKGSITIFGDIEKSRLMKAEYNDKEEEFVNPKSLPEPFNQNTQDTGFVPSSDGKGYFFSSMRDDGYGGWDLYYAKYENGKFSEPINLGPDINSDRNEIYLSIIIETIYFCSDRAGGFGNYDIYTTKISIKENSFKIIVRDKKTNKPIETEVRLTTKIKENDKDEKSYEIKKNTDLNGEVVVTHKPQVEKLDAFINKDGYLPLFDRFDIASLKGKPKILELSPVEKEASFDIHSIYFDFESAKIKSESFEFLDELSAYLKKNKSMRFEIIGHTDLHGNDDFNNKLSLERAKSVRDYLVNKGIDKDRFTVTGIGKTRPVIPEISTKADIKNRRTEFKVLEK